MRNKRHPRTKRYAIEALENRQLLSTSAIVSGLTANGTVTVGETDTFNFSASAGESVVIALSEKVQSTANARPSVELRAPNGTIIAANVGYYSGTISVQNLAAGGNYSILVTDQGKDQAYDYAITLAKLDGSQSADENGTTALVSGKTRNANVGLGDLDVFTFSASAGESFSIVMGEKVQSTANMRPQLDVYGPSGILLRSNVGYYSGVADLQNLAVGGTYYVVAHEQGADQAGDYAITLAKLDGSQNADENGSTNLVSGLTRSGNVGIGDLDVFTFSANAGESFSVVMGETVQSTANMRPQLDVYGPTGTLLRSNVGYYSAIADLQNLAVTGTYYVVAHEQGGDQTGDYNVTLAKLDGAQNANENGTTALVSGKTRSGNVGIGDLDVFTFSANAGESFSVVVGEKVQSTANMRPQLDVYGPTGTLLRSNVGYYSGVADLQNLAQTGTYYVVVRDQGSDQTGDYAITLAKLDGSQNADENGTTNLVSGATRSGNVGLGDLDVFTFNADAGESFSVVVGEKVQSTANMRPQMDVYGPSGQLLRSSVGYYSALADLQNLAQTGTYYVVVRDQGADQAGDYAITLAKLDGPQDSGGDGGYIASASTRNANIGLGDQDVHLFTAAAGDRITILMSDKTGSTADLSPQLFLYGPAGQLLRTTSGYTSATIDYLSLPTTGTYYVVARDLNADQAGDYSIRATLTHGSAKPTVSVVATDPLATEPGSDTGTFTFSRSFPRATPLVVNYTISGTARNGTDYVTIAGSTTIGPNSASSTVTIKALADTLAEGTENVSVSINNASAYNVDGAKRSATVNIAASGTGKISGTVFNDADRDGVKDAGEAGLSGRTVFIDLDNDNVLDPNERRAVTNSSGNYEFANLPTGSFRLRAVPPSGSFVSLPTSRLYDVSLAVGQIVTGRHFGIAKNV